MKIHEHVAKRIFRDNGIAVPRGAVATTPMEAQKIAEELGGRVVVKAQVLVAGRGKAGGVKLAHGAVEAARLAKEMLGQSIKGIPVRAVLVEEQLEIEQELYLGFTIDRASRRSVLIISAEGGVELEDLARARPQSVVKRSIDPFLGLRPFEARSAARAARIPSAVAPEVASAAVRMYDLFTRYDCELLESNPLALARATGLVAADTRMIVDDSSRFRHPSLEGRAEEQSILEQEAAAAGFSFVELNGEVGIIGNGAGLVMATLDMVAHYGGRPANFLDVGGGARADQVAKAIGIVLRHAPVRALLVNILGGITRCDEVAAGLVHALQQAAKRVPMVVRLVGTNEEEGQRILTQAGIDFMHSMEDAAAQAVRYVR